jgi:uncharacterized protein YciI
VAGQPVITDQMIEKEVANVRRYFLALSKAGPKRDQPPEEADRIQKEHLRHNLELRARGILLVHGPVTDDEDLKGIGIYVGAAKEEVQRLVDSNPSAVAGRLIYEVHEWYGFPGDCLREAR